MRLCSYYTDTRKINKGHLLLPKWWTALTDFAKSGSLLIFTQGSLRPRYLSNPRNRLQMHEIYIMRSKKEHSIKKKYRRRRFLLVHFFLRPLRQRCWSFITFLTLRLGVLVVTSRQYGARVVFNEAIHFIK